MCGFACSPLGGGGACPNACPFFGCRDRPCDTVWCIAIAYVCLCRAVLPKDGQTSVSRSCTRVDTVHVAALAWFALEQQQQGHCIHTVTTSSRREGFNAHQLQHSRCAAYAHRKELSAVHAACHHHSSQCLSVPAAIQLESCGRDASTQALETNPYIAIDKATKPMVDA